MDEPVVLLIDGDQYLYRTAAAMEQETEWEPGIWTRYLNVTAAWDSVCRQVSALMNRFHTPHVVFALTAPENWRKSVLPSYKANRAGVKKPCGYEALVHRARLHPTAVLYPPLEADDIIGIRHTRPDKYKTIVVSSDKDMQSLPGALYNPDTEELREIAVEEADLYHLTQTLTGDTADGYAGCPGVGPVKAAKLLEEAPTWGTVVAAYANAGLGEEEALVQARVARILRHGEYERTGGVKLWTPAK